MTAGLPLRQDRRQQRVAPCPSRSFGEPATIGTHRLPMPGSASSASAVRVQIVRSRSTCAVTSTGLSSEANGGKRRLQCVDSRGAEPRNVEAERVAEIEREALDRARIGDDAGALHRRLEARQQLRGVDQLFQRVDHGDGGMAQQRGHDGIVARERAGVRAGRSRARAGCGRRCIRTMGLPQRGRAAPAARNSLRLADLLDEQRDDLACRRRRSARRGSLRAVRSASFPVEM